LLFLPADLKPDKVAGTVVASEVERTTTTRVKVLPLGLLPVRPVVLPLAQPQGVRKTPLLHPLQALRLLLLPLLLPVQAPTTLPTAETTTAGTLRKA
jgi:hypothetical protein